jgi:xylan 1,4-beta-xylosidase
MFRIVIALICAAVIVVAAQSTPTPVSIHVDLTTTKGSYKPIYSWFGYDESNYTTMKYGRQLLTELHDLSPAPVYIRAHHLLTSGTGVAELKWSSSNVFSLDAQGRPIYDFTITDQTFDAWLKAGVRPMVEFGFMPKDLVATIAGVNTYQVHFPGKVLSGAANNPPKDYAMWGELIRKYTEHLVQRYGKEETSTWYWEVWNEPDIDYWHGTPEDYNKLYDYAVAGVRKALPNALVGGPASTGPASEKAVAFLGNFLKHVANDKSAADGKTIPLDFISFHPKGSPTMVDGHVRMGLSRELITAESGFKTVAKFPKFQHTPIILSEADPEGCAACSAKVNPANNYRNGPLYPVYTAVAIKALFELQDRNNVNLISMLTWAFEFEDHEYFEGFRTLATNGIDKPVLNVFRMAGLMSGDRVATTSTSQVPLDQILKNGVSQTPDIDAFATKAAHEAAVMLWNYHDDDVAAEGATVQVTIAGIPGNIHRVQLHHYRIDQNHSNAYAVWRAMGSPQNPILEQYSQLKAAGQLQLLESPRWLDVKDGKVNISTDLPRQATSLLQLQW